MEEPELELDDIQGHLLVGFGGGYQQLLGFRFQPEGIAAAREILLGYLDRVTTGRASARARVLRRIAGLMFGPAPEADAVGLAISFSHAGLRALGSFEGPEDIYFRDGAGRSAGALNDDVAADGTPLGWEVGADDATTPDVFAVLGAMEEGPLADLAEQLIGDLRDHADLIFRKTGTRLPGDTEHFGFADGISQPGPRGLVNGVPLTERTLPATDPFHDYFARPGQPLIWPGQYLYGYATQQAESDTPGPIAGEGEPLLRNGSLLVFRQLRQDVVAFREAMAALAASFTAAGFATDPATAAASCVGRWPDGTPLSVSPAGPDEDISTVSIRRNGFLYRSKLAPATLTVNGLPVAFPGAGNDNFGINCPFFSHIRKVNPRDTPVDQGGNGITLKSQMLRRGIPFGPAWTEATNGAPRGLLFMSYQTSIEHQFHRLMTVWVNNPAAPPPTPQGIDPIIGAPQGGRTLTRRPANQRNYRAVLPGRWVTATGAGYFFAPGLAAMRAILRGT